MSKPKIEWTDATWDPVKNPTSPLRRRERTRYCLKTDIFDPGINMQVVDRVFVLMALEKRHRFVVVTSYPERMRAYLEMMGGGL